MNDLAFLLSERLPSVTMAFEGDAGYDDLTAEWNLYTHARPLGVVQPTTAPQVQAVIEGARQAGVTQLAVRSGGHSFEGTGLGGPDGRALVIDTVKMNEVSIDRQAQVATVGSGATTGKLYLQAWENGELMAPMGMCVSVGMSGQSSAGGYGFYSRTFGPLTDRILQFEVVTADGRLVVADDHDHCDLYWALRGSGTGSFGVITKIKVKLNPAPKATANFTLRYAVPGLDFDRVFGAFQDYCLSSSIKINPMIVLWQGVLELTGSIMADTGEECDALIGDMLAKLPPPTTREITHLPFIESVRIYGLTQTSAPYYQSLSSIPREGRENLRYMKIKAGFVPEPFPDEFITALGKLAGIQPITGTRVQILGLNPDGGLPVEATAVKNRGCPWLMGMSVVIDATKIGEAAARNQAADRLPWLNECYELFYPHTTGGYIGDADINEGDHGRDLFESYYGDHLPRLKAIKRTYDPDNLFHHALSIPLQ